MKAIHHNIYTLALILLSASAAIAQCNTSKDYLESHYDSTRADFSKEVYNPSSNEFKNIHNVLSNFKTFDCGPIWTDNLGQEGILGLDYWRIQVKIISAEKDKSNPYTYHVSGVSKYKDSLINFSGTIKMIAADMNTSDPTEIDSTIHGTVYAEYNFLQDASALNGGILKGIETTDFMIDAKHKQLIRDTVFGVGDDDYADDTFVGTWEKYHSAKAIKYIFGLGRLPFTFDFDKGDGDMAPNDRYRKNGWQDYPDDEWTNAPEGTVAVKWWLKK